MKVWGQSFYDLDFNHITGEADIKCLFLFVSQELEAVRDALIPLLACAAAKLGDVDALRAIAEMVMWNSQFVNEYSSRAVHDRRKLILSGKQWYKVP